MGKIKSLFEVSEPVKGEVTLPAEEYRNLMLESYLLKNLFKLKEGWNADVVLYVAEGDVRDIAEALFKNSEFAESHVLKESFYAFDVTIATRKPTETEEEEE